jgi:hypothetical protein
MLEQIPSLTLTWATAKSRWRNIPHLLSIPEVIVVTFGVAFTWICPSTNPPDDTRDVTDTGCSTSGFSDIRIFGGQLGKIFSASYTVQSDGSSPCTQEPATEPYPQSIASRLHPKDHFNIFLVNMFRYPKIHSFISSDFRTKILLVFLISPMLAAVSAHEL